MEWIRQAMLVRVLEKTPQGVTAIKNSFITLSMVERSVLILLDGKRTVSDVQAVIGKDTLKLVDILRAKGLANWVGAVQTPSQTAGNQKPKPGAPLQASARGVLLGKMHLLEVVERLLGHPDKEMRETVQSIHDQVVLQELLDQVLEGLRKVAGVEVAESTRQSFFAAMKE